MAEVFKPITPRPAPIKTEGLWPWVRSNLLGDWRSITTTVLIFGLLAAYVPGIVDWALLQSVTVPDSNACHSWRRRATSANSSLMVAIVAASTKSSITK